MSRSSKNIITAVIIAETVAAGVVWASNNVRTVKDLIG